MTQKEALEKSIVSIDEIYDLSTRMMLCSPDEVLIGDFTENKHDSPGLYIKDGERNTHMHVMGRSGGGKSRLMEFMLRQDIQRGNGVCVIDPHGELYWNLVFFLIKECPEDIWERVYLINPSQDDYLIQFNPFFSGQETGVDTQVDKVLLALEKVWEKGLTESPGIQKYLSLIIETAIILNIPTIEILSLLYSHEKRQDVFHKMEKERENITDEIFRFWRDLVSNPKNAENILSGAHTRLRHLLSSPALQMMTLGNPSLDLAEAINNNGIILVNIAKSKTFSLKNQKIFGTLLLNELVNFFDIRAESFRYAGDPDKKSSWDPFFLYVDEFQRYITPDIGEILAGGRKFGLHLVMANQTFSQIDPELREQITNIASSKAYFAVKDLNIAIELWKQSAVYKPQIKETIKKFQTIDEGYSSSPSLSESTDYWGRTTRTVSERQVKNTSSIEYDDNKYFTEGEVALMEGKKIQNLRPRHFIFTSDGFPEGVIVKTEWCFDIQCTDEEIKDFHKWIADSRPELYRPVKILREKLDSFIFPFRNNNSFIKHLDVDTEEEEDDIFS